MTSDSRDFLPLGFVFIAAGSSGCRDVGEPVFGGAEAGTRAAFAHIAGSLRLTYSVGTPPTQP